MVKELGNVVSRRSEQSLFLQVEDALARFLVEAIDIDGVVSSQMIMISMKYLMSFSDNFLIKLTFIRIII